MAVTGVFGLSGHALERLQLALIVAPSFILFGYNQAGIGGLLTEEDWNKTFPEIDTTNTEGAQKSYNSTIQGLVVATFVIGALFGSLSCSYTGEKFGRRAVVFAGAICTLIGEVLECSAFSLAHFIVGRIIIGAGVGMLSATVPVWQSETSGAKNRGQHVVLDGLFICVGYVLESWIDLGFFELPEGPVTWRPPLAIPIIFSLVLMGSVYLFPESPRWLVRRARVDEARTNIAMFRGYDEDSMEVQAELAGIELSLEETANSGASLKDMLKMGEDKLLYRFGLCILLQFYQQMSGSNLISVYTSILFQQNLGMSPELSRVLSGGALTWKFLSSFVAFFTIDRFGRRAVFMFSGCGMSACMIALAITTSFGKENHAAQVAAGCFIYLFNFFVPIGFLGANFLYCTEVAPIRLRVAMSSISTANHWLWNFVVVMVTPVALANIAWRYYIVYAVIGACIPITVYFFYPETMGRNLEELDLMFRESPSVLATVRFAKKRPIAMPQEFAIEKKGGVEHESDLEKEKDLA
ncbi:Sugar transporter [Neofusicoccum parvum]|uniref:Sugar transporter n=1 Tax=Neofusicoccum parvum TaxID=310453 RepID=A0ACB5S676_9PEZI|nr:Sugar transporter [Neofusicoccum parvum]GME44682.1 Sugar transporter [Neofusicoccum parvum]